MPNTTLPQDGISQNENAQAEIGQLGLEEAPPIPSASSANTDTTSPLTTSSARTIEIHADVDGAERRAKPSIVVESRRFTSNTWIRFVAISLLAASIAIPAVSCRQSSTKPIKVSQEKKNTQTDWQLPATALEQQQLASEQPLGFLEACLAHYDDNINDYRCRFVKQEKIDGTWGPEQHIDIKFRESPFSVDMTWTQNAGRASRVNYIKGHRVNDEGEEMLQAFPKGVLGLLVPNGVERPIYGEAALATSRKPIDRFGFRNSLELIIRFCKLAAESDQYALTYKGIESFKGLVEFEERDCFVLERRLPYADGDDTYPDRVLDIYIDQEWFVPVGVYAYADDSRENPLGKYLLLNADYNVGLTDEDFLD
ncbi:MAG: DUF1571 domain-containing protein [Phycisphaerae bacterium]